MANGELQRPLHEGRPPDSKSDSLERFVGPASPRSPAEGQIDSEFTGLASMSAWHQQSPSVGLAVSAGAEALRLWLEPGGSPAAATKTSRQGFPTQAGHAPSWIPSRQTLRLLRQLRHLNSGSSMARGQMIRGGPARAATYGQWCGTLRVSSAAAVTKRRRPEGLRQFDRQSRESPADGRGGVG